MVYKLDEMKGRVFTLSEVAEMLGVKPDAIRRRVRLGQLPVKRPPGSEMLVDGDELAAYLLGETATATPKPRKPRAKPERVESQAVALPFNGEAPAQPVEAPAPPPPLAPTPGPSRAARIAATLPKGDATAIPFRLPDEARDRLKAWMAATGRNQPAVCREAGINASSLSYIVGESFTRKRRALCRDNVLRLQAAYGDALLLWILGKGPMPVDQ